MSDDAELERFIQANYPHASLKAIWDKLLTSQKRESVPITCRCGCNKTFKYDVEFEDRKTIAEMAKWLGERGYGKAAPVKPREDKPIDLGVDPASLSSDERRQRIEQLRRKLGDA